MMAMSPRAGGTAAAARTGRAAARWPVPLLLGLLLLAPAPSSALTADGVMLLAFRYSVLSDPLSVLASWNYDDETPCAWNGVACAGVPGDGGRNDTSRVVSLVLPGARLLGSLPADLGLIPHLRHLDLSGNSLNGTLPPALFASNSSVPSELRVLSLAGNLIFGELPDMAAAVATLTNLQVLNLSDNALTGRLPPALALLPNLTLLSLSGNYLSGAIPNASDGGFPRAEYVDLSSNLFNGTLPPNFAAGGAVRYLNLSYNRFGGEIPPGFAAKFPRGAVVDLSFNNLTGAVPESGPLVDQKPGALEGNLDLCGRPLKVPCPITSTPYEPPPRDTPSPETETPPAGANSPPAFAAIPKTVNGSTPGGSGGSSASEGAGSQRGLKPAAIAGIIAGDVGGIALLFLIFAYVYQTKRKKRLDQQHEQQLQQQQQQQQANRGLGPSKAGSSVATKQQPWASKPSTVSSSEATAQSGGGMLFCLGRKAGTASDESEDTSTASDTEGDDAGKGGAEDDTKLHKASQKQQPPPAGVLVTVDGETELELETLLKASAYILGATGSSIVYKAVLADGTVFAVRRIGESGGGGSDRLRDFEAQVRSIAKLRHPNLLSIRGFYWGADEKLLIYDYAANGSLANISYKKLGSSPYHLPWDTRLRIARGVARGLAYLHEKKFVHGNVKPSNILLSHEMEAMIGDFGLERLNSGDGSGKPGFSARHFGSKRSTLSQSSQPEALASPAAGGGAAASPGAAASSSSCPYHAPESLKNLKPSTKWDVYSFGVILLELLTGRVFCEAELCQWSAAGFPAEEKNRVLRMADPTIRGEVDGREEGLLSCFRLGFGCAAVAPQRRPSMKEASQVLDKMPSPICSSLPA